MDGIRRPKDDIAFEALGAVDEAQVTLGVCRSLALDYCTAVADAAGETSSPGASVFPGNGLFRRRRPGKSTIPSANGAKSGGDSHDVSPSDVVDRLKRLSGDLSVIQKDLLIAGGILSSSPGDALPDTMARIDDARIRDLGRIFDRWRGEVHIEPRFFIAGESRLGAELDRARTVVRRAERRVATLIRERGNREQIPVSRYLNQLSDLCFVVARWADSVLPLT